MADTNINGDHPFSVDTPRGNVTFQREPLCIATAGAMEGIARSYYASTPAHHGLPPYQFNWPVYFKLDQGMSLLVVSARCRGEMIGYGLYVLVEHPHHVGWKLAQCDTLAVVPEMRGAEIGRRIVQYATALLRPLGVQRMTQSRRLVYGRSSLFEDLGFRQEEILYVKDL